MRNTRDVKILIRRDDPPAAVRALANTGFMHRRTAGIETFLDGPQAKARDAVLVFAHREEVRPEYSAPAPDGVECEEAPNFRILMLEALVPMKRTSFRDKDRTHLRDLIEVGLLDASRPGRAPPALGQRLQGLLDNTEGYP